MSWRDRYNKPPRLKLVRDGEPPLAPRRQPVAGRDLSSSQSASALASHRSR